MNDQAHVTIPLKVWGRLATVADHRGVTISDLLVAAIERVISPTDRQEQVLQLVREGLDDGVISTRLGESRMYVATVRRHAGMNANRVKHNPDRPSTVLEQVRDLWNQGFTDADVAERLHVSIPWAAQMRRDLGLAPHRKYTHHENGTAV